MRTPAALVAASAASIALVMALAGCSGSPEPAPSASVDCSFTAPGPASDSVSVSGDFDTAPTTTFATPVTSDITERSVVITGTGAVATSGAQATVDFTLYNATTGAQLFSTLDAGGQALPIIVDESQFLPGLVKAVACSAVGSRVVVVVPPGDAYGSDGNAALGVTPADALVFVVDVKDVGPAPTPTATTGTTTGE
ncbi:FKBP-type peptidyl-prolyl cis-trans isomerase [Subtercola boreus]|uniref:Peptidyl-prolyl cis-trans isomerase n=1 Tax=Subtercola boreus TaxID=120213 RepID=A0A3E0W995_9MICO|nr:FKBP-type peptidyl-prolyl cis-trans isomerase [Subtercola boreus]RFA20257.1 hypothetical protein B7R24_09600 [Subtercola boreus]RFA20409.1 hypothetical protein B7R23_09535 [Subtercola boreus]RFA26661.1 hypothetical protein B7R25_09665 [Subtercola boreus]